MTIRYVDFENGSDAAAGTSFATRKKTISSATSGASGGDIIRIMESLSPTSLGVLADWTNQSDIVNLHSAVNATVTNCESAWAASTNVTASTSSTRRQGNLSASLAIASGFTTGKVGYFGIASTDYSSYQQICFWIQPNASVAANTFRMNLCSDTIGDVPVDSFDIDFAMSSSVWYPVVINKGAALGSAIQSVALYALTDPGTVTVLLDNIFVATASSDADSLTLNSLIGKNTAGETFWAIKSISGVTVTLDNSPGSGSTMRGYYGTSETVITYKRETVKNAITSGTIQSASTSGSLGSPITLSGGWSSVDMATQTGETWMDGRTGQGTGFSISGNYYAFEKLSCVRCSTAFSLTGTGHSGAILAANNNTNVGISLSSSDCNFTEIGAAVANTSGLQNFAAGRQIINNIYNLHSNTANGMSFSSALNLAVSGVINASNNANIGISYTSGSAQIGTINTHRNGATGLSITNSGLTFIQEVNSNNNTTNGVDFSGNTSPVTIYQLNTSGNGTRSVNFTAPNNWVENYIIRSNMQEGTTITVPAANPNDCRIYSQNESNTLNNNRILFSGGRIEVDTGDPPVMSGLDYKVYITSSIRTANYPVRFSVGKVAVDAGTQVTISADIKKSHSTNITAFLVLPGGQLQGVLNDVSVEATTTSYATYSINFTPTEKGVAEFFLVVYSTTGSTTDTVQIGNLDIQQV